VVFDAFQSDVGSQYLRQTVQCRWESYRHSWSTPRFWAARYTHQWTPRWRIPAHAGRNASVVWSGVV